MVNGIKFNEKESEVFIPCIKGKQTRLPFPKNKADTSDQGGTEVLRRYPQRLCKHTEFPDFVVKQVICSKNSRRSIKWKIMDDKEKFVNKRQCLGFEKPT